MVERGCSLDVISYNILINGYCKGKKIDEAMRLFHEMSNKGMIPNVVTYNTLIGGFCQVKRPQAALELFHNMQAFGQHQNPKTYANLLDGLLKNKQIAEAMALFQEAYNCKRTLPTKGLQPDVPTYNIMIRGYAKRD
nr:pentatricopeptide repeat-containing protein At3g22470, mitochondrial-like [Quercus suber]